MSTMTMSLWMRPRLELELRFRLLLLRLLPLSHSSGSKGRHVLASVRSCLLARAVATAAVTRGCNCKRNNCNCNCNKRARHLPQLLLRAVRRLLLLNFQAAGCDYIALEIYENAFGAQLIEGYISSVMKLAYNFSKRLGRWNMKCQLSFLYNQIYLFSCQYCVIFIS